MAAAFAYVAKLPGYVFHSEAGVFGKTRFEDTIAIERFGALLRIIPPDVPSWNRFEGKSREAPLRVFADEKIDRYWADEHSASDGCLMNPGSQKGADFICLPIGIKPEGLQVEARKAVQFRVHDPLSGKELTSATLRAGERLRLPSGPGALIILGQIDSD